MFGKILVTNEDRNQYRSLYEKSSGGNISDDYLNSSTVRAFYNSQGEMVAGYMLNKKPNFRYLLYIPENEMRKISLSPQSDSIAEITCIWMTRKKLRPLQRYFIYTQVIIDSLNCGADFILGGSVVEKVKNIQFNILNQPLWEGISTQSQYQWVYYGKRDEILGNYCKELGRECRRILKRQKEKIFNKNSLSQFKSISASQTQCTEKREE